MNKTSEHKCSRRTDAEESIKEKDIVGPKVVKPTPAKAEPPVPVPKEIVKEPVTVVKEPEPITKTSPPLQPIIKQPHPSTTASPPLQPIIKANGRSEKSNITQGRTVLFVEPPKKHSGILLNKNEVPPRNTYDPVYPGRRRLSMKGTNGEVPHRELPRDIHRELPRDLPRNLSQDVPHVGYHPRLRDRSYSSGMYIGRDGDYHEPPPMGRRPPLMREHSISRDPREPIMRTDPPMRRHRNSMEDPFGNGNLKSQQFLSSSSTALTQEPGFHPAPRGPMRSGSGHSKHLPPREARMGPRDPNMLRDPHISSRDPRLLRDPHHPSRDPHLPPRERMSMQDRHLAKRASGHVRVFPPGIKRDYDHIPPGSPPFHPPSIMKKSPSVSAYVGHHYDDSPAVRQENVAYRSLPRPSRRGEREALYKYNSLDRRFDLPFSGSLPRPEPRFASDEALHQRHYNVGSPHHRYADEKNYHLYHDKEKKQDGMVDEIDESFV